jgi:hypothetical protein
VTVPRKRTGPDRYTRPRLGTTSPGVPARPRATRSRRLSRTNRRRRRLRDLGRSTGRDSGGDRESGRDSRRRPSRQFDTSNRRPRFNRQPRRRGRRSFSFPGGRCSPSLSQLSLRCHLPRPRHRLHLHGLRHLHRRRHRHHRQDRRRVSRWRLRHLPAHRWRRRRPQARHSRHHRRRRAHHLRPRGPRAHRWCHRRRSDGPRPGRASRIVTLPARTSASSACLARRPHPRCRLRPSRNRRRNWSDPARGMSLRQRRTRGK